MSSIIDDNVLQLYASEEDVLDIDIVSNYINLEALFLKFFHKGSGNIEVFIKDIFGLLYDKFIKIKGLCFKGVNSVLIEVLLTDSLRNWLIVLIEARNNIRSLSEKSRSDILKIAFGKFNLVIRNELIHMNVIPNIIEHTVECRSSFYPYGLCNGNFINVLAKNIRDDPVDIIKNIVSKRADGDILAKIYGTHLEFATASDISVRFIIRTEDLSDSLLKSLNAVFGALSFCSSTMHFVPAVQEEKFTSIVGGAIGTQEFWSSLSEIDVLICNKNEQSMAMVRKNLPKKGNVSMPALESNFAPSPSPAPRGQSIFDRLGPKLTICRTFSSSSK